MSRLTDATPVKTIQAECSKDDFGFADYVN